METADRLSKLMGAASDRLNDIRPPVPDALFVNVVYAHVGGLKEFCIGETRDDGDYLWVPAERISGYQEAKRAWWEAVTNESQAKRALLAATAETSADLLLQIVVLEIITGTDGDDIKGDLAVGLFASARALRGIATSSDGGIDV